MQNEFLKSQEEWGVASDNLRMQPNEIQEDLEKSVKDVKKQIEEEKK